MDKENIVNEIMRSLEERQSVIVDRLCKMGEEAMAFEVQNIWDEVNYVRDENPDFNFERWGNS